MSANPYYSRTTCRVTRLNLVGMRWKFKLSWKYKDECKVVPTHAIKVYVTMEVQLHPFLTSAWEVICQLHDTAVIPLGKRGPGTHWLGGWLGPAWTYGRRRRRWWWWWWWCAVGLYFYWYVKQCLLKSHASISSTGGICSRETVRQGVSGRWQSAFETAGCNEEGV